MDGGESPSVTTMLGSAGACPEIRHAGKVWKVGHPSQRAKAELEKLAVQQAMSEVMALKEALSPQAYAEIFQGLRNDIAAKHYRTWGEGWQRVVWGPMSAQLFFLSLLRENHPDATEDDVLALAGAQPEQVTAAILQVVPPFVLLLLSDRKDITPEQREQLMGVVMTALGQSHPKASRPQPAPTPATSAASSNSGSKHSHKSRGVSRRTPSPV